MDETKVYEALAKHLDQGIMGSPKSPALMEILKILFPSDEAEIAVKLPMQNKSLSELKSMFPERADSLGPVLDRMAKRGTVYRGQRPGEEPKYRLLPSVVGWAETPFWAGKETEEARKLAPLWLKYREEAFGAELARGGMPVMRVIPVSKTITDPSEVLPFEALRPKVEAQSFFAVAHCPCRQMKRYVGEGCAHSLENCLHFGAMGRYMVEQGMARQISKEDTLRILKEANEEGLVHASENMEGHLSTICNCCGCCCVFLDTKKRTGLHTISSSNYMASVDGDRCVACGTCEERCPMGAIALDGGDMAVVDEARCIGCGVCSPTCPSDAVELRERAEIKPPPGLQEFLAKRWKTL